MSVPHLHWFEISLIPAAYHVRDASSEKLAVNAQTRAVRLTQLTAEHSYQFPTATANAAAADASAIDSRDVDPELTRNRSELGSALAAVAGLSALVPHPSPEAALPRHSVLAYAAAQLPVTSPIDPMRLGQQLLFPAPRPSSRKQVSYLFFALQHMLKQVGKQQESATGASSSAPLPSSAAVCVPSLLDDLPTYARWCGLAPPAAAVSGGMSSVADLAIGASTHTPAPKPPPPTYSAAAATGTAAASSTAAAPSAASAPSVSSLATPSTIDFRFETNVASLQRFAEHDNAVPRDATAHVRLPSMLHELSVYLVGMHEIARQEYSHCQERGDLLHMLVQRCATLLQSVLPVAQREVVATVAEFKGQIHQLLRQQEVKFEAERMEWAKTNTRNSAQMIQLSDEIRRLNTAINRMEAELVRRRRECSETDRILQRNAELESQLASLREQVAASAAWRADQQLTLEQLHFALKQSNLARSSLEQERDSVVKAAADDKQRAEQALLSMQTRFLELRIPDQIDPQVQREVQQMMEQRTKDVAQLQSAAQMRAAGAADEATRFAAASVSYAADADPLTRDADRDSESSLSSHSDDDDDDEDDDALSESSLPASASSSRHKQRPPSRHSPHSMLAPPGSAYSVASAAGLSEEAASDAESADSDETATSVGTSVTGSIAPSVDLSSSSAAASGSASASTRRSGHARKPSTSAQLKSLSAPGARIYAGLCKIAHLELQSSEIDAYLLTSPSRFFHLFVTPKQRIKFHQLRASAAAVAAASSRKAPRVHVKLGGQVGPRDWLVNFCWSVLAKRQESEAVSDCYQTPRQPFPEFFYALMLHHESVDGGAGAVSMDGHKSVLQSMVLTALKSMIKYRAVVHVARVLLDLIEEKISLDGCSFLSAIMTAVARTSVGIDYGPGRFGATRWVCTLRTRFVSRLLRDSLGEAALTALNAAVESRAESMSLSEVKQQQSRALRVGVVSDPAADVEPMQAQQLALLTKIDLGEFMHLASVHFSDSWKAQIKNIKAHFNGGASVKAAMGFAQFKAFVLQLQPNLDSRHVQQLYADCVIHSKQSRDGVRFDDFLSGGGSQLLLHDHARAVYRASDYGAVHGHREIVAAVTSNWARLKPALEPFKQLALTDGSALSVLLSERLTRLESDLESCLSSLHPCVSSPGVRSLVCAFRDCVYEVYGFLRFREETGASVRTHVRPHPAATLSPAAAPPIVDVATAPGPSAAHLTDELHAMLFMLQREMEAFCPMQPLPAHMMIHSDHS